MGAMAAVAEVEVVAEAAVVPETLVAVVEKEIIEQSPRIINIHLLVPLQIQYS